MVEDQEAEPLLPQQEERPYLDDGAWPPAQPEQLETIPPQPNEETQTEPDSTAIAKAAPPELPVFKADTPAPGQDQESSESTTSDADESPLEPFG